MFKILFIFSFTSVLGWVIETTYRFIMSKKLVNPGFMSGCVVPIYGFGAIILYYVAVVYTIQGLYHIKKPHPSMITAAMEEYKERHKDDKVLIFTQYSDTANYIYRQLKKRGVNVRTDVFTVGEAKKELLSLLKGGAAQ